MLSSTLGFSRHSAKLSEVSAFASLLHHQFWSNFKWRGLDSAHMGWVRLGTNCGTVSCMALQEIVSQLYILHAGILLSALLGFANLKVLKPIQI